MVVVFSYRGHSPRVFEARVLLTTDSVRKINEHSLRRNTHVGFSYLVVSEVTPEKLRQILPAP